MREAVIGREAVEDANAEIEAVQQDVEEDPEAEDHGPDRDQIEREGVTPASSSDARRQRAHRPVGAAASDRRLSAGVGSKPRRDDPRA